MLRLGGNVADWGLLGIGRVLGIGKSVGDLENCWGFGETLGIGGNVGDWWNFLGLGEIWGMEIGDIA